MAGFYDLLIISHAVLDRIHACTRTHAHTHTRTHTRARTHAQATSVFYDLPVISQAVLDNYMAMGKCSDLGGSCSDNSVGATCAVCMQCLSLWCG